MNSFVAVFPIFFFLLWLGLLVYLVVLATRLVNSTEQIARTLADRLPPRPRE